MMEFIVDFGSWNLEAKNEQEAREKVIERIGEMDYPEISNIEEVD